MTMPPDNGYEPADLSELTATDALLDRLGGRNASEDDLLDPAASVLGTLLAFVDQSREPDVDAVRLIEVLAGRPLYITGSEAATDEVPQMIDLTEPGDVQLDGSQQAGHQTAGSSEDDRSEVAARIATGSEPLVPPSRFPRPAAIPIRSGASVISPRRWDRVLSQVSVPAASVLLLVAVGGGVSAAVTGNPMAPVDGITRVMEQIPGIDDSSLDKVKSEINAARQAVFQRDASAAAMHLSKARAGLNDVPDADKGELNEMIEAVAIMVSPTAPPPVTGGSTAEVTAGPGSPGAGSPTDEPAVNPSPSTEPTATAAPPEDPEPSSDPVPTIEPNTPEPEPTTEAPVIEATSAATDPAP
ncbi:MAG TPA: hypothetical protein VLL08_23760 [Kineosporiaceae bacterium]|nr:hypothetical protein [Kineosporiaceae bacterium]